MGSMMQSGDRPTDFGFAQAAVPHGTHVCQIYDEKEERTDAFLKFLLKGLQLKELSAGFSDDLDYDAIAAHLTNGNVPDSVQVAKASDVYFQDHRFSPEGMLERLVGFHDRSRDDGFSGARIIGEMAPEIYDMEGCDRLLEYEARVNMLLRDRPMTVMCQYNARSFTGSTLMDVLKAHALMVVRGTIVHNPFYVPPETLLGAN